jgi:carbon-monoxide dehydrogenase medium subunit
VKPARFEYERPATLNEATEILAGRGEHAAPLAGGQSLVPLMNLRRASPELIVDLNELNELRHIVEENGDLVIGALVRQRLLERSPLVRERCPLVAHAMTYVGTPQTRNRGTAGGSVSHADPNAELVTVMVASDATVKLESQSGPRVVPAADFFESPFRTTRRQDELVVEVRIPTTHPGWAFHELTNPTRAPATVAVAMVSDAAGAVSAGVSGIAPMPVRVSCIDELDAHAGDRHRSAVARELFDRCRRDLHARANTRNGE